MPQTLKAEKCIICHSPDSEDILSFNHPDQYEATVGVSEKDYFRKWVRCTGCGFSYSIYSRGEGVIDQIYTSAYRDANAGWRHGTTEEIFNKAINLPPEESETAFRVQWIKSKVETLWDSQLTEKTRPPYKLLDIGGGSAVFAYLFQDHQWQSYVVDANVSGDFIEKKLKIPFIQDYYKPGQFGVQFDLLSLVFVLEHLSDPEGILKMIASDLKKDSFLYIEVPDVINFEKKEHDDDIFNSCHLWMFSPDSLTKLLDRCGFKVQALDRVKTKRGHLALMVLAGKKKEKND